MKKTIATLMTLLFLGSTGLVFAQTGTKPSATPVAKTAKKSPKKVNPKVVKKAPVKAKTPTTK